MNGHIFVGWLLLALSMSFAATLAFSQSEGQRGCRKPAGAKGVMAARSHARTRPFAPGEKGAMQLFMNSAHPIWVLHSLIRLHCRRD